MPASADNTPHVTCLAFMPKRLIPVVHTVEQRDDPAHLGLLPPPADAYRYYTYSWPERKAFDVSGWRFPGGVWFWTNSVDSHLPRGVDPLAVDRLYYNGHIRAVLTRTKRLRPFGNNDRVV